MAVRTVPSGDGEPVVLPGTGEPVGQVAFSPDGHHLASASMDDSVLVWDLRTRTDPVELRGHRAAVESLAFSPDGSHLASAGNDGVIVWNLAATADPTVLRSHQDVVWHATHSPDGRYVVTNGGDATISIWRTDSTSAPLVLDGFRASVRTVAPLTNERYVTGHDDGTVRIWRWSVCGPIAEVLANTGQHLTRELTPEERRTYLPDGA